MFEISTTNLDLDGAEAFAQYSSKIAKLYCPYMIPASKEGVLLQSALPKLPFETEMEFSAAVCIAVISMTERLRKFRQKNQNKKGVLYCDNLVFDTPAHLQGEVHFIQTVHMVLNVLYAEVGIIFGAFLKTGEIKSKRNNGIILSPPHHFIAVRSLIKPVDFHFFEYSAPLLEKVTHSHDDGRNVFAELDAIYPGFYPFSSLTDVERYEILIKWAKEKALIVKDQSNL